MKRIILFATVLFLAIACQNEEQTRVKSRMKFSMESTIRSTPEGRSAASQNDETPVAVVAEVYDVTSGSYSQFQLSVYNFNGAWVSDAVELYSGQHQLTQFFVIGESGQVIYATPIEGSDLAQFVTDPLAVDFVVSENELTMVTPQVLAIEQGDTPTSFGYIGFSFEVVDGGHPTNDSTITDSSTIVNITFDGTGLINPYITSNGIDSVEIYFTDQAGYELDAAYKKTLVSNNGIFSATLTYNELSQYLEYVKSPNLDNPSFGKIIIHMFYESIDNVEQITHTIEDSYFSEIEVTNNIKEINISNNNLFVSTNAETSNYNIIHSWGKSHLFDNNGLFYFLIQNDFCSPRISYGVSADIVGGFFYKSINEYSYLDSTWNEAVGLSLDLQPDLSTYPEAFDKYGHELYVKPNYFEGICLNDYNAGNVGSLYFRGLKADNTYIDCYLVWVAEDTPIDPVYPGGSSRLVLKKGSPIPNMDGLIKSVKNNNSL